MANYTATITTFIAGDFKQVPWEATIPSNSQVTKAWLTVKANETDLDASAILQKEITTVLDTGEGHITDNGSSDGIAAGFFNMLESETIDITPDTLMYYDIQLLLLMTDATTRIATPEKGTIQTLQGLTDAVS
jgi:hypothetical protein